MSKQIFSKSFLEGETYKYDRIKPKELYKMAYGDIKYLNNRKKRLKLNAMRLIPIIIIGSIIITNFIENITPIIISIIISIIILLIYFVKVGEIRTEHKKMGIIGLISKSMRNKSYKVTSFIDNRSRTNFIFLYRQTKSPYSNASKKYYHQPWLSYDTNLKNLNKNVDGVKLKIDSFFKTKTKSGGIIRQIFTIKIKFFFKIDFIMSQSEFDSLIQQLYYDNVNSPDNKIEYTKELFILFPSDDIIEFKLKITSPFDKFKPISLPPIIQDFWNDINVAYQNIMGKPLIPLKSGYIAKKFDVNKIVKETYQLENLAEEEKLEYIEFNEPEKTEKSKLIQNIVIKETAYHDEFITNKDIALVLKNISISFDKYREEKSENGINYIFTPRYNYFSEVKISISSSILITFICRDKIRNKLKFSIDTNTSKINYEHDSFIPRDNLLKKYRIKSFVESAKNEDGFDQIIVNTSDTLVATIIIPVNDFNLIEEAVNFAKSLLQELKFIY